MVKHALLLLTTVSVVTGCQSDLAVPEVGEPFFHLVLIPGGNTGGQATGSQYAMALDIMSAAEFSCRPVEQLDMRRGSDGALFDWRVDGTCDFPPGGIPRPPMAACCTLPFEGVGGELGAEALQPGESYSIVVTTGDLTVRGTTTMPGVPQVTVVGAPDAPVAVWSPVPGATGYRVLDDDYTTDTTYALPPGHGVVQIEALDPNLWVYRTDDQVLSSGIQGALGVFGSAAESPEVAY